MPIVEIKISETIIRIHFQFEAYAQPCAIQMLIRHYFQFIIIIIVHTSGLTVCGCLELKVNDSLVFFFLAQLIHK